MQCKRMQKNNTSWYIVLNMGTKKFKTKFHATLKSPVFTGALGVHQWSFWGFLAKKSEIVRHIMTHYYQKITSALNFFNNYQLFIWEAKWNTPLGVSSDIHTLTSKSVLKNSATLRFSTHFSVSEYQISTQLNRNKLWFSCQGQHLLRQAVGVFQKKVIFRWIYTKSIFVNCTFTSLILRRPTSFTRTTSDVWESGCTFA